MLLTLDIGNSSVKGGLFEGSTLRHVFRVAVDSVDVEDRSPADAWGDALRPQLDDVTVDRVGIASVVPATAQAVTKVLQTIPVTRIHPDLSLPFEMTYQTPDTLGADRLAAAVAGWETEGRAASPARSVIVVDAGTAVTYEVVHRDGVYEGGAIGAGPGLVRRALRSGTAQLPAVPLTVPDDPVGRSTNLALQSGVMWGFVEQVAGMLRRLATTLPDSPHVVLTGGWSPLLAKHLDVSHTRRPHLVLDGIRRLVARVDD